MNQFQFLIFLLFALNTTFSQTNNSASKTIKSIRVGNQLWMTENLNVSKFSNGQNIIQAQSDEEWEQAGFKGMPAWCYQMMDTVNSLQMKPKLYNRFVVMDMRNVCPDGWRVASNKDWNSLIEFYKGFSMAAKYMKASVWEDSLKYDNEFNALPVGWRDEGFGDYGTDAVWWSKDKSYDEGTCYYSIVSNETFVIKYSTTWRNGYSIRCVKTID